MNQLLVDIWEDHLIQEIIDVEVLIDMEDILAQEEIIAMILMIEIVTEEVQEKDGIVIMMIETDMMIGIVTIDTNNEIAFT